jgi:hypothetical protein
LLISTTASFCREKWERDAQVNARLSYLHHTTFTVVNFVQIRQIVAHDDHQPK